MRNLIATALLLLSSAANAAETTQAYLCIPEYATGFSFNKVAKRWQPSNFDLAGKKYLVKKTAKGWSWANFAYPDVADECGNFNKSGVLVCDAFPEEVWFNRTNGRFQVFYFVGYVGNLLGEEGGDNPNIAIGTCAPL